METLNAGYKTHYLFSNRQFMFEKLNIRNVVKGIRVSKDGYALFEGPEFKNMIGIFRGYRFWINTRFSFFIGWRAKSLK